MTTKHTPAPWEADGPYITARAALAGRGIAGSDTLAEFRQHIENWQANIRLSTAAPDLLEALQELAYAADGLGGYMSDNTMNRWSNAKAKARAALSKATGQP